MRRKRLRRKLIGSRGPAQAQIDAARKQAFQGAELLGDHQRRMIRQHDAARPDADGLGSRRHMPDHHRGGRARNPGHAVMLRQPVALIPPALGMPRQIQRIAQRLRRVAAHDHRRQVEN